MIVVAVATEAKPCILFPNQAARTPPALKDSLLNFEPAKKIAEGYIATTEDFANR
jgi:hypothetical protein